jgi:hypothetical protein
MAEFSGVARGKLGFETIRFKDCVPRPTDRDIRFWGLLELGVTGWVERLGVGVLGIVGVARPLRGIRLGVMTTDGILGGGEPKTLAIGDAFHRGRAWIGISPPVPVPRAVLGLWVGVFNRDAKKDNRFDLEDEDAAVDTDRSRCAGVAKRLSLRGGAGREITLFPDRMEDPREEV